MTVLVPLMLFGWVPLSIAMFMRFPTHRAILFSMIGGWLFLPMAIYNLQGLPPYSKNTAIAIGLIVGSLISGYRPVPEVRWGLYDLPMLIYCLCPISTSLVNDLGLYDGLSASFQQIITWGIPYWAGRKYFGTIEHLRDLCVAIVIGGLMYVPFCWYEIRMSPQLSNIFYGFFPHSFAQHMRGSGFRPIVFMQHGLMVALWMAVSATVAYWFWRGREVERIKGFFFSLPILVTALALTTILCKSVNGLFALVVGFLTYSLFKGFKSNSPILMLLLLIPIYIGLRATDSLSVNTVCSIAESFVNEERVESLGVRLYQETVFSEKAWERPWFGWGGYDRGWPTNPDTGEKVVRMIDSTWLIIFSTYGLVGLISLFFAMLQGPWRVLRFTRKRSVDGSLYLVPILLSLVVILFMIDSLSNGMKNPVYILASGAVISWYLAARDGQQP